MLINITASSQLGIHDVHEACNLIRTATENNDVQINFGVVLDEKMGENVKITVIATGFQRDTLPEIDRRNPHFPFTVVSSSEVPVLATAAAAGASSTGESEGPVAVQAHEAEPAVEEMAPRDDYDTPAILRKHKRMVQ